MPQPFTALVKRMFKSWGVKIVLITLLLALAVLGSIWLVSGSTLKQETATFAEQVKELSSLATAEAHL